MKILFSLLIFITMGFCLAAQEILFADYFDIQVNGYAGYDFNSLQFNSDQAEVVYSKLTEDNVEGILATIITDDFDRMIKKINNIVSIINNNKNLKKIIKGLHIEGPFLNPENGYRGAHPESSIVPHS